MKCAAWCWPLQPVPIRTRLGCALTSIFGACLAELLTALRLILTNRMNSPVVFCRVFDTMAGCCSFDPLAGVF